MSRPGLTTRIARREDAPLLARLWGDALRRADPTEQTADVELIIKSSLASAEERIVVVECDGRLAGAVLLRVTTLSPLNLETCVQSLYPRVFDQFRRRGVGKALMEAAASYAEEAGITHVATAVPHSSREANRFMARLGLAPVVLYRVAPTSVLRSRVSPQRSAGAENARSRVIAARRSALRRRVPLEDRAAES